MINTKHSLRAAVALAALTVAAPAVAFAGPEPILVTVTDKGCKPDTVESDAGKTTFRIKNESQRALEWEILNGVMVVDERENILPGFVQSLTTTLDAGEYQMTCGLLSNPKGILKVAANTAAKVKPTAMDLVAPLAQYKVYVTGEIEALVSQTKIFVEAIKSGNLSQAQKAYAPAHMRYERIEPIAELFNDLDGSMDSREDDFEKKADDPKFTGFHKIEKVLFADKTTAGLTPLTDKLMTDVLDLQKRIGDLAIAPKNLVGGAAELIEEVATKKITGEEDRYSRTDLWDFQANVDGAKKIVTLLGPIVQKQDATLSSRMQANFQKVDAVLAKYKVPGGGFESYEKLSETDRGTLKAPITSLAEDLSTLKGTLGVE
jgi:iron uptake system component EfeO